jgi:hypothetical protein
MAEDELTQLVGRVIERRRSCYQLGLEPGDLSADRCLVR